MDGLSSQDNAKRYNVLIIDDEILVSKTIGEMLQFINSTVFYAENAYKAFEIIKREKIDLIILDALLPDMDGFQAASTIRKMDESSDIPIIMLSGVYKKMKYKYQAKEAGINVFLSKPVAIDTLLPEIDKLLK